MKIWEIYLPNKQSSNLGVHTRGDLRFPQGYTGTDGFKGINF